MALNSIASRESASKMLSFNLRSIDMYVPSAHHCIRREEWAGAQAKATQEQLILLQEVFFWQRT